MKTTSPLFAALTLGIGVAASLTTRADILYASGSDRIWKVPTNGGAPSVYQFQGLFPPVGLAFDSVGHLYVTHPSSFYVDVLPERDPNLLIFPQYLAFDRQNNLYVTGGPGSRIVKIGAGGASIFASDSDGLVGPKGLAFDSAGDLYVANSGNNTIMKFTPDGVGSIFASEGLNNPIGLAFDSAENLYVTTNGGGIIRFARDGIGAPFSGVGGYGLAFDSTGILYVATDGGIDKVTPDGAFSRFTDPFVVNHPKDIAITDDAGVPLPLPIGRVVPEPTAATLMVFGALLAGVRRRRNA